jgi:hypothetical protein
MPEQCLVNLSHIEFKIMMAVAMKITIFWNVTTSSLVQDSTLCFLFIQ